MQSIYAQIGKYWDDYHKPPARTRWWQSPHIIRHYNYRVCGKSLPGWNAGPCDLLGQLSGHRVFKKAVSVGCGSGSKEMRMIEAGLVEHFVCYELSKQRISIGEELAQKKGISSRIEFHYGDFYKSEDNQTDSFDLVFWDNSLHHMLDTRDAVKNSREVLKTGGYFFCNDYIGENRFQWTDLELAIINGIRHSLPEEVFRAGDRRIDRYIKRPDLQHMIDSDYSEAADSENIVQAVHDTFENPLIRYTGGYVYHTCLNDILQNIPEESDLLNYLLTLDDEITNHGFSQYAFILAKK